MRATNEVRTRPYGWQQNVYAMQGFGVKLKFMFHNVVRSRGTVRSMSGLTFRFAPFLSPPMPATAQTQTLAVIGPGQFGHLTGDTLLTKISHMDK